MNWLTWTTNTMASEPTHLSIAVHGARPLLSEGRVAAPEGEQVLVQAAVLAVGFTLLPSQFAPLKCGQVMRFRQTGLRLLRREAGKLRQECRPSSPDGRRQLALMIRKIQERARCSELLSLKEHRRRGQQEDERGDGAVSSRRGVLMQSGSVPGVGNLIVVL